ncbi:MAG: ion transporter, partial [Chloroflexi bacterium]|nr:ion transporter [Chloroflexota bacterium]
MFNKRKSQVFNILNNNLAFTLSLVVLIALNVTAVIMETVGDLSDQNASIFRTFEIVSVAVFTAEYLLRIWTCTNDPVYKRPLIGRLRFAITFLALVDIFAILPFYLPMLIPIDLRFLRALRLFRIFRLLKIGRYSESLRLMGNVLKSKREEITIAIFVAFILLILSSSVMYYVEHDAQPNAFPSIPSSMWWGVTTLTTVGYGDISPITALGKFIGAIVAVLGIGLFALPAGILAAGFSEELQKRKK